MPYRVFCFEHYVHETLSGNISPAGFIAVWYVTAMRPRQGTQILQGLLFEHYGHETLSVHRNFIGFIVVWHLPHNPHKPSPLLNLS